MDIGDCVPPFTVVDEEGKPFTQEDLLGQPTLLYFYPKDDTSGCTAQACAFRDSLDLFKEAGVRVIGVNPAPSHKKFVSKYHLNFPILCDVEQELCSLFDVWKEKSMYGRKYMGVQRATFLIDAHGKVVWLERNVAVPGSVERALNSIEGLYGKDRR